MPDRDQPWADRISTHLEALIEPLRKDVAVLDRQIEETEAELKKLHVARRQAQRALNVLVPEEKPQKQNAKQNGRDTYGAKKMAAANLAAKVEAADKWLREHPDAFEDGFTANRFAEEMTKNVPKGLSVVSARQVIEELRDRGLVRADKIVRGGGMGYQRVSN